MKKLMKRIGAVLMAVAMMAALGVSAWANQTVGDPPAATPAYDKPLTVTGLETGDVVHFYQVIKWVGASETGNVAGWKAVTPFNTVLDEATLTAVLVGTPAVPASTDPETGDEIPAQSAVAKTGITAALAGRLAKVVATATPAPTATDYTVKASDNGVATLQNAEEGMWMALVTPANKDVVYNPAFVSADYNTAEGQEGTVALTTALGYDDKATAKKSTPDLNKTASVNEAPTWENWNTDFKWASTAIGETVNFTVEVTIPAFKDVYTNPYFKMTDKLTDLKLVENSVKIVSPDGAKAEGAATITEAADGLSYTILFDDDYLKTIAVPTKVTVSYSATVTSTAALHVNPEKNEVWTEFSNNPSDESEHGYKKDDTIHYTFTLDANALGCYSNQTGKKTSELVKVRVDANGKPVIEEKVYSQVDERNYYQDPLAGAEFKLYTAESCASGTEYYGANTVIVSGDDGRLTIQGSDVEGISGLDAGTYWLKETKAPTGFVADTTPHKIELKATFKSVEVTEYAIEDDTGKVSWISAADYAKITDATEKAKYTPYTYETDVIDTYKVFVDGNAAPTASYTFNNQGTDAEIVWDETGPVEKPFEIKNTEGTELPSTGGIGTYVFTVAGVAIMAVAAGLLIVRHKKKAE